LIVRRLPVFRLADAAPASRYSDGKLTLSAQPKEQRETAETRTQPWPCWFDMEPLSPDDPVVPAVSLATCPYSVNFGA
jgi:hypothetical protein